MLESDHERFGLLRSVGERVVQEEWLNVDQENADVRAVDPRNCHADPPLLRPVQPIDRSGNTKTPLFRALASTRLVCELCGRQTPQQRWGQPPM